MGFGLLFLGYFAVLGTLPSALIYSDILIIPGMVFSILLLCGSKLLARYNIYFKLSFICSAVFTVILLALIPFELRPSIIAGYSGTYMIISKISRFTVLLFLHTFLFNGIRKLAADIDNTRIKRMSVISLWVIYFYFFSAVLSTIRVELSQLSLLTGLLMFFFNAVVIWFCYAGITYEGHDEAVEEAYEKKMDKKNGKKKN